MSQSQSKESSSVVTVLAVISLIFGIMGMLGSFIPCLGSLAFFLALPSALLAGVGFFMAQQRREPKTFVLVALTISSIGLAISGVQMVGLLGGAASLTAPAFEEGQEF